MDGEGGLSDQPVLVNSDGRSYYAPAERACCCARERALPCGLISITTSRWSREPATCLIGEVSMCNDDVKDNRFYENVGRFPEIEEDEEPYRLLCFEYPDAKEKGDWS